MGATDGGRSLSSALVDRETPCIREKDGIMSNWVFPAIPFGMWTVQTAEWRRALQAQASVKRISAAHFADCANVPSGSECRKWLLKDLAVLMSVARRTPDQGEIVTCVCLDGLKVGRSPGRETITYCVDVQDVPLWGAPMVMCGVASRMLPSSWSNALLVSHIG